MDGAHVEFLSGLDNPIGIKVGPSMDPEELVKITDKLNPSNEPGRITLIVRMGAENIENAHPRYLSILHYVEQLSLSIYLSGG